MGAVWSAATSYWAVWDEEDFRKCDKKLKTVMYSQRAAKRCGRLLVLRGRLLMHAALALAPPCVALLARSCPAVGASLLTPRPRRAASRVLLSRESCNSTIHVPWPYLYPCRP